MTKTQIISISNNVQDINLLKFHKLSYGVVHHGGDNDPQLIAEILNDVMAVAAPSNPAISYSVYFVQLKR